ncbi:MAG TPA: DUF2892 domain-containing protein [Burkholderiaceae bacterium]|jgi:hypothetical protein|nr:DUF2892 domain-containing protein [Burkholderiaceae bacterium]
MKVNVGTIDRAVRIIVGAALVIMAAMGQIGVWGWIGLLPLATGLIGNCPAYSLLGVSTCRVKSEGAK